MHDEVPQYFLCQLQGSFKLADRRRGEIELKDRVKPFGEFVDGISEAAFTPIIAVSDGTPAAIDESRNFFVDRGERLFFHRRADDVD